MEIKFCFGNISARGNEVALKFTFDPPTIEQLKTLLNRHRYAFQLQTNMQGWQVGGWLAEKKVWYLRQEIWPTINEALCALGHRFVAMTRRQSHQIQAS